MSRLNSRTLTNVLTCYIIGYKIPRIITILHQPHTCNYTRMICNSIFSILIHAYYRYLPSKITIMKCMYVHAYLSPPVCFDIYHWDQTLLIRDSIYLTLCDNNTAFKLAFSILICTQSLAFYDESPRKVQKRPHSTATWLVTLAATSRGLKLHEYLIPYFKSCYPVLECIN